jgi:uncharacterized iron-regulated membrane protein
MGIILALFLFVQAFSGAWLALESLLGAPVSGGWGTKLHVGGGILGQVYRLLLGLGLMGMAASGSLIYLKIRARSGK